MEALREGFSCIDGIGPISRFSITNLKLCRTYNYPNYSPPTVPVWNKIPDLRPVNTIAGGRVSFQSGKPNAYAYVRFWEKLRNTLYTPRLALHRLTVCHAIISNFAAKVPENR